MISNDDIGNLGRLGNQMFQYAALRGIAARHNYEYCLPPNYVVGQRDPNCGASDTNIFKCFKIPEAPRGLTNFSRIGESAFEFDENLFNNCPDNVNIYGYFQTEKYFKHIEDEIRKAFTFIDEIREISHSFFERMFSMSDVISLHIRRGDYLINPNHPVQDFNYYKLAIKKYPKEMPVIVFSDDYKWCYDQPFFKDDRYFISESCNTSIDLCLMSLCKYHIIANSSFSWWGAWLANSKNVIAPSNWFGGSLKDNKTTIDLILDDWIVI